MRIFSSAEYCLRVARRMSLMTCSAGAFPVPDFCLIFAPLKGYDEPEILRYQLSQFGPISADAGQSLASPIPIREPQSQTGFVPPELTLDTSSPAILHSISRSNLARKLSLSNCNAS